LSSRVVDANIVVKWYIDEPASETARAVFWETDEFSIPDLLFLETASILWKKARRGELTHREARDISGLITEGPFVIYGSRDLASEAVRIALEHEITPYDASYVALAMKLQTDCATADRKLFEKLRSTNLRGYVTLVSDAVQ
jgi:predicted nucleic acid-binding protein